MGYDDRTNTFKKIKDNLYSIIKMKQNNGWVDCCKEFKFIRSINTISFNNKIAQLGISDLVLKDKYDCGEIVEDSIVKSIKSSSNIVIGIFGYTGTGKSELAQTIALISQNANKKYKNREVKIHICWTTADLFNTLNIIKKGDIIIKDECPKSFGRGARTEKWSVDNALAIIRKMENTIIFCDPKRINVDICNMYFESAGMDFDEKMNRFLVLDDERHYIGHIYAVLHKDKKLRTRYEKEKDLFIKKTLERSGHFLAEMKGATEVNDIQDLKARMASSKELLALKLELEEEVLNELYTGEKRDKDIQLYLQYERGNTTFDKLANIYGYDGASGAFHAHRRVKDFLENNQEGKTKEL